MLNKPMRTKKRGRDIVATLLYHLDNDTIILVLQCSFRWSSYLTCCRPKTRKEDERWWESSWLARDTRFSNFYTVATIAYFSTRYQVSSFGMAAAATNEQAPGQPIHKQKPLNTEADSVVVAVVELDSLPYTAARDNAVSVVISTSLCIRSDSKKSIHWILLWMWNRVPAYLAPWNTTGHVRFLWSSFWQTYNAHTPEFRSDWYTESAQYHHNTGHTLCHNSPWMTTTENYKNDNTAVRYSCWQNGFLLGLSWIYFRFKRPGELNGHIVFLDNYYGKEPSSGIASQLTWLIKNDKKTAYYYAIVQYLYGAS